MENGDQPKQPEQSVWNDDKASKALGSLMESHAKHIDSCVIDVYVEKYNSLSRYIQQRISGGQLDNDMIKSLKEQSQIANAKVLAYQKEIDRLKAENQSLKEEKEIPARG